MGTPLGSSDSDDSTGSIKFLLDQPFISVHRSPSPSSSFFLTGFMGRRAKNKQGDPLPLDLDPDLNDSEPLKLKAKPRPRGPVQDFDFDTDSEDDEVFDFSAKFSQDSDSEDEGEKTTIANMEARSRALDAEAAREAELDMQELQDAAAAGDTEDEDLEEMDVDEDDDEESGPSEPVKILTTEEREVEKKAGGPDVSTVQRRLRHCVRVLQDFKRLGKGRYDTRVRVLVISLTSCSGGEPNTCLSWYPTSLATTGTMSSWPRNFSTCFQLERSVSWFYSLRGTDSFV